MAEESTPADPTLLCSFCHKSQSEVEKLVCSAPRADQPRVWGRLYCQCIGNDLAAMAHGAEVDRPLWKHWLTIVRPERVTTNTGLLAKQGWKAYFIEITFPTAWPYRYQFTTGVRVTPDRLPFESPAEVEGTAARSGTASDR